MSTRFLLGELDIKNRITKIWMYITNHRDKLASKAPVTATTGRGVIIEDVVEVVSSTLVEKVGVISWSRSGPRVSRSSGIIEKKG